MTALDSKISPQQHWGNTVTITLSNIFLSRNETKQITSSARLVGGVRIISGVSVSLATRHCLAVMLARQWLHSSHLHSNCEPPELFLIPFLCPTVVVPILSTRIQSCCKTSYYSTHEFSSESCIKLEEFKRRSNELTFNSSSKQFPNLV